MEELKPCPSCNGTGVYFIHSEYHNTTGGSMKRVYVAGAYSADNVLDIMDNMRRGMRVSTEVLLAGFAPFCPWLDYHFQLMLRDEERLTVADYYAYSIAWLKVSDMMLVLPNSEHSRGTQVEIGIAKEMGIPVWYYRPGMFNDAIREKAEQYSA